MNRFVVAPLLVSCLAAQQEIVHYTFDSTDTDQVLNYARGSSAPAFAPATSSFTGIYTSGRFGSALEHSPYMGGMGNYLNTGWQGGHSGAFTVAFWLRNGNASSMQGAYSPIAGQPAWRIGTGGSASPGLQLVGWGGPAVTGTFATPVAAMTGWNHFAVVVDPAASLATWYHNGAPASSTPITGGMVATSGELLVGTDWTTPCGSFYDIDEFRMLGRAATPAEVAAMAQTLDPLVQTFGTGNALQLDTNDLPTLGNASFALQVASPTPAVFVLAAGFSYAMSGPLALPFDLGTVLPGASGQLLRVAPTATLAGLVQEGHVAVPLAIPAQPQLLGTQLFAQAIGFPAAGVAASNALALRVGQ